MKLTETDLQDACGYIIDAICKSAYGDDYVAKGYHLDLKRTPVSIRQIVDEFIIWLKIRHKQQKNVQKI